MTTFQHNQSASDLSAQTDWRLSMPTDSTSIIRGGLRWVGIALAAFVIWGLLFPLSSSVVAVGTVTPRGQAKLIQHPSGGVVAEILAKDGDYLKQGDVIARIEPAVATAELANLLAQKSLLEAREARLRSIQNGYSSFVSPRFSELGELRGTQSGMATVALDISAELRNVIQEQQVELQASSLRLSKEVSALEKQLEGLVQERESLEVRLKRQLDREMIIQDKVNRMRPLAEEGHIAKSRLWDTQAQLAELAGMSSQIEGLIKKSDASIAETRDRITVLQSGSKEEFAKERSEVLAELASINQQIRAAELAVMYSDMRAPVNGTLTKLQISTIGGVIEPGSTIAELIPEGAVAEVETKIAPQDIGDIEIGQDVEMVITSLSRRQYDPIRGRVSYLAADSSLDERTGESHFLVRIEPTLDEGPSSAVARLAPGMQADVYIKTGSRSFFSWLLAPIFDSVKRAFNEA